MVHRHPRSAKKVRPSPLVSVACLLAASLLLAACGSSSPSGGNGLEKTHITVGALPIPDAAPLFIAIHKGFFKQEGLAVTPETIQASPQSTPYLVSGAMDFSLLNYVSTLETEQNSGVRFRIVADSTQAAPGVFVLLVPEHSPVTSPADLKGKTIGAPEASNGIGNLAVASTLKPYGVPPDQVKSVALPFPDMEGALKRGVVAAAWVTEPFITEIRHNIGARVLADTMTGPMASFPISGWGTVQQYVRKYPKTVAAFQRAMAKAQRLAASNRQLVEQTLPTYTKIKPKVASVMALGTYPVSLRATRLQHVADVMLQFGFLHKKSDVAPMVLSGAR